MADKMASQSAASFSHTAKILHSRTCDATSMKKSAGDVLAKCLK